MVLHGLGFQNVASLLTYKNVIKFGVSANFAKLQAHGMSKKLS